MRYIVSLCIALCASLAGAVFFRLGAQALENEPDRFPKPIMAGMCVCNAALAVCMTGIHGSGQLEILRAVLLCAVLWACAWTDWKAYLIPNKILLAALLLRMGIFALELLAESQRVLYTAAGAAVSAAGLLTAGILCRLIVPGSIGFGDLKLFGVMGLYLGADGAWNAVFYTLLASFIVSVFLLVTKRASKKSVMPFAPFLLFGTLFAAFLYGI